MSNRRYKTVKWVSLLIIILTSIVFTIILVRAFDARNLPDLQLWHSTILTEEFRSGTSDNQLTFQQYIEIENRVFDELDKKIFSQTEEDTDTSTNRYVKGSNVHPGRFTRNWNRSYELTTTQPKAAVVLLHGLTDSPYSMRTIANILHEQGFYVLVPRMPGHGTIPSALRHATWQDWMAVTKMAVRHMRTVVGKDVPFYLGGYSNGGALAVKYTLESLPDDHLERPERLLLFSPAMGVTRFAAIASWHKLLSDIPYFRKFEWESIQPEYDPFKYNSFPKMAGHQSFSLAGEITRQFDENAEHLAHWPATLTFQSLIDSTVLTRSVVEQLYNRLETEKNELVLYDVNRANQLAGFFPQKKSMHELDTILSQRATLPSPYTLTLITNLHGNSLETVVRSWRGTFNEAIEQPLSTPWPRGVYSLSHVAIPFSPDDPYYGDGRHSATNGIPALGALSPRGEKDTLLVPAQQLMRLRHNPFFDDLKSRIIEFCFVHDQQSGTLK